VVDTRARPAGAGKPIEIALPNGRVVRVPPEFDAAELERVLAIASGEA
jgi:transposase